MPHAELHLKIVQYFASGWVFFYFAGIYKLEILKLSLSKQSQDLSNMNIVVKCTILVELNGCHGITPGEKILKMLSMQKYNQT